MSNVEEGEKKLTRCDQKKKEAGRMHRGQKNKAENETDNSEGWVLKLILQ